MDIRMDIIQMASTTKMQLTNSKFNENNVYRVRKTTKLNQGLFLLKLILKKHGNVQIEGMGECISLVAKFSQILSKHGYADLKTIRSENVERDNRSTINPKMIVVLNKSKQFDTLTEGLILRQ